MVSAYMKRMKWDNLFLHIIVFLLIWEEQIREVEWQLRVLKVGNGFVHYPNYC